MSVKENAREEELERVAEEEILEAEIEMSETETLKAEVEALKDKVAELEGDYIRKNAEFQNFRRRQEAQFEELKKYASEKIIVKLLDNVDNLERAIAASSETKDFDSLIKGVDMTLTQMKNIMQSEGVEEVVSEGATYDPVVHHAVMVEDSPEFENDQIIAVFQKAYKMKDKVIRPAMVKVCKK
jgi:molecular chaperone GrpE